MLLEWLAHWEKYHFGYWAMTTIVDLQQVIGFGGLMYKDILGKTRANLYFRFHPEAWGQGYATEMGRVAQQVAFEFLNLKQIVATVRPSNTPSIRVFERLGMVYHSDISDDKGNSYYYISKRVN